MPRRPRASIRISQETLGTIMRVKDDSSVECCEWFRKGTRKMRYRISPVYRLWLIAVVLGGTAGLADIAFAQSAPHIGKWSLNVAKSVYTPGPPPRSQVRTYSSAGNGLK